jgi:DNA-directed RNA polymerase specialized sigma24 family protein
MSSTNNDGTVTFYLKQLKAGESGAARPIWDAYFVKLVNVVRGKLKSFPRMASDEEDVALSALRSFCERVDKGAFPKLDDRGDLWQVLYVITTRKALSLIRRESTLKKGGGRVVQASALCGDSDANALEQFAGTEPTPEHAAEIAEEYTRLLNKLVDADLRQLAIWKLEGFTNAEIAGKINRSIPTVERKLARIRTQWEREIVG